jgi:hypothetical protein
MTDTFTRARLYQTRFQNSLRLLFYKQVRMAGVKRLASRLALSSRVSADAG